MREGYRSVLEFLEADFEIEEEQEHLYNQLATASHDAKVKETFQHLARAARGTRMLLEELFGILNQIITMCVFIVSCVGGRSVLEKCPL